MVLPELFEDARSEKCKQYTKVFYSASRNTEPSGHNPQMANLERKVRAENTDIVYSHINGIPQIVSSVTAFRVWLCQLRVLGKGNNKWITIIKIPVLCHDQPIQLTLKINFIDTIMQLYGPTVDFSVRLSALHNGAVGPSGHTLSVLDDRCNTNSNGRTGTNEALTRHFSGSTGPQSLIRNSWGQMNLKLKVFQIFSKVIIR